MALVLPTLREETCVANMKEEVMMSSATNLKEEAYIVVDAISKEEMNNLNKESSALLSPI